MAGISNEIDKLARKLAKRLASEDTSLSQLTDGFKALAQYSLGLVKAKKAPDKWDDMPLDDSNGDRAADTTIEGIRNQIRAVK